MCREWNDVDRETRGQERVNRNEVSMKELLGTYKLITQINSVRGIIKHMRHERLRWTDMGS